MIRIDNPEGLGPALGQVRAMLQIGRRELARQIAAATGRDARAVNSQLWGWENGDYAPNPTSLGPVLAELGYQLALVPLNESGPQAALSGPVTAETPTVGVLGRPEGQKTAHGAPEAFPEHLRGDGPCHDCGTANNIVWFTDSPFWNAVMGGPEATDDPGGILCIPCFVVRADAARLAPKGWRLLNADETVPAPCQEETYSWHHFTPEQVDPYWIRCTLQGPHDEHQDESTGLTWRTPGPLVVDSCTCGGYLQADPDCPVHHGRRARGSKPPPVGPGCICDGSGRTCPRHGAVT